MERDVMKKDRYVALLTLILGGCWAMPGELEDGRPDVCLAGPEDDTDVLDEGQSAWKYDVQGKVAGSALPEGGWNLHPCGRSNDQVKVVEIVDGDGESWFIGWTVADSDGEDATPELDLTEGQDVSFTFVSVQDFGTAGGFAIQDDAGLVGAIEVGSWGVALPHDAVPGLSVELGDTTERTTTDCGLVHENEMRFIGDDTVDIEPFGEDVVKVDGKELHVMAIAAWEYPNGPECTDAAGNISWAIYR